MTTKEKRFAIIKKCVEANPDIAKLKHAAFSIAPPHIDIRSIRLTDIFVALNAQQPAIFIAQTSPEPGKTLVSKQFEEVVTKWDWAHDDLLHQESHTIDFIYSLFSTIDEKIIRAVWRSGRDTVGVVAVDVGDKKWSAFIGVAKCFDDGADAVRIAQYGARLTKLEACAFFPDLDPNGFETNEK